MRLKDPEKERDNEIERYGETEKEIIRLKGRERKRDNET